MARTSPTRKPRRGEHAAEAPELMGRLTRGAAHAPEMETLPDAEIEEIVEEAFSEGVHEDESETDWTVRVPLEPPAPEQSALPLTFRDVTEADQDALWDWIRADADRGYIFLGSAPTTSAEMRERLALFGEHLAAIDEPSGHIGFVGYSPVTEHYVGLHLYVEASNRVNLYRIAPALIPETWGRYPGRKITVMTDDPAIMKLYEPLGFTSTVVLTLLPPTV